MTHHFDPAPIAKIVGIAAADLGIALISHQLDGIEYESVLLFNKTVAAPVAGVLPKVRVDSFHAAPASEI